MSTSTMLDKLAALPSTVPMTEKELLRDIILGICGTCGDVSALFDVWEPDCTYRHNEAVTIQAGRWIGTTPARFNVTHVRVSCNYNTGVSLTAALQIGQGSSTLGTIVWPYVSGMDSILVPWASLNSTLGSSLLPAGARIELDSETSGSYGSQMNGLQFAFLGRWVA